MSSAFIFVNGQQNCLRSTDVQCKGLRLIMWQGKLIHCSGKNKSYMLSVIIDSFEEFQMVKVEKEHFGPRAFSIRVPAK